MTQSAPSLSLSATTIARAYFLTMFAPVAVSAIGPYYYGYTQAPYSRVVFWTLACTVSFYWMERWTFNVGFRMEAGPHSFWGKSSAAAFFVLLATLTFLAVNSLAYGLAKSAGG
jgi:hypothetical protein